MPNTETKGATWGELSYYVLEELRRQELRDCELEKRIRLLEKEVLILKTKAWAFGLLAGAGASLAVTWASSHIRRGG